MVWGIIALKSGGMSKALPCTIQKIRDVENSKNQKSEAEFSANQPQELSLPWSPQK